MILTKEILLLQKRAGIITESQYKEKLAEVDINLDDKEQSVVDDVKDEMSAILKTIETEFNKGKNRGPEFSKLETSYMKMILGFHRLAINGLNDVSNQPLVINDIVLVCNGEIYNYKELYNSMNITPVTQSDCEVIIHLYLKYGIEQTLSMLDGVYAFILYDNRITNDLTNRVYVARDPFGVRPLYWSQISDEYGDQTLFFSSMLGGICKIPNTSKADHFPPGHYMKVNNSAFK